jgi:hypothetical protein
MCTFNTASGCDCRCECDILLREDRDMCPEHGTRKPQPQRRVSVGRTRPLFDLPADTVLDSLETSINKHYMLGELTSEQRRIFTWAIRTCREISRTYALDYDEL